MVRRVSFVAVFALVALAALSAKQVTSHSPVAFQEGGAQPSAERTAPKPGVLGPAPNFVGNTTTLDTTGYTVGRRIFAAGAHNATWHAHSAGQLVFAEKGRGRVAIQGQPIRELAVGESAFIPGGTVHWHGASPNEDFTMVYITMGASRTSQGDPVTEDAYLGKRK
jgi:quercetin dioxygenase-like cupin family protein